MDYMEWLGRFPAVEVPIRRVGNLPGGRYCDDDDEVPHDAPCVRCGGTDHAVCGELPVAARSPLLRG